ncbi:MAG: anthranilate synthase subunit [Herbinix sp.]|jgi:anthranilate synthase/aminodeoxychorismate synthase-like glutamine amidotransferase|nr:anthranilate synthase subunit [Herbinix sp.]
MKYFMIDNNDSFVYNLAAYFKELGQEIQVENIKDIRLNSFHINNLKGIIISPGPGTPEQAVISSDIVNNYAGKIPILGVCLGHQVIGHCFGATVKKGRRPMHGKISTLHHTEERLFHGLPSSFQVTRYHSLVIDQSTLSNEWIIDAVTDDEEIMAISHIKYPLYGVQFHPEALLTEYGHELLSNFIKLSEVWESGNVSN